MRTESNAVPSPGRCQPGGACSGRYVAHAARPGGGQLRARTSRGSSGARAARWPTARAHACTCPQSALRCSGLSTTNKSQSDISVSILVQFGQHSLMHVLVLGQSTVVLVYLQQTNLNQTFHSVYWCNSVTFAHACTCPLSALRCSGLSTTNKSQSDVSFGILVQFGHIRSCMYLSSVSPPLFWFIYNKQISIRRFIRYIGAIRSHSLMHVLVLGQPSVVLVYLQQTNLNQTFHSVYWCNSVTFAHACTCPLSALRCSGLSPTNKSQSDVSFRILVQFGITVNKMC